MSMFTSTQSTYSRKQKVKQSMLDLKFIRENLDLVKQGVKNKREKVDLDRLVSLDAKRRKILQEVLRALGYS